MFYSASDFINLKIRWFHCLVFLGLMQRDCPYAFMYIGNDLRNKKSVFSLCVVKIVA